MIAFRPEDFWTVVVFVALGLLIVFAILEADRRQGWREREDAESTLGALLQLDPTLLAPFGRQENAGWADEFRTLDRKKVQRLAATLKTVDERESDQRELRRALELLQEARA